MVLWTPLWQTIPHRISFFTILAGKNSRKWQSGLASLTERTASLSQAWDRIFATLITMDCQTYGIRLWSLRLFLTIGVNAMEPLRMPLSPAVLHDQLQRCPAGEMALLIWTTTD